MANWRKFLRDRWRYFDAALALAVIIGSLVYIYELLVGSRGLDVAYITRNYPLYLHAVFTNVYATTIAFVIVFLPQYASEGILIGIIALAINTGGYQAEIFRAGLQTVHSGQIEAARAIGFSRLKAMRYVILPQALRLIIPPLTNEYIGLFKASTLLFVLGVQTEISYIAQHEGFAGDVFEIFAIVTAIFLAITVTLSLIVQTLEKRFRIPGLGIEQIRRPRGVRIARVGG